MPYDTNMRHGACIDMIYEYFEESEMYGMRHAVCNVVLYAIRMLLLQSMCSPRAKGRLG